MRAYVDPQMARILADMAAARFTHAPLAARSSSVDSLGHKTSKSQVHQAYGLYVTARNRGTFQDSRRSGSLAIAECPTGPCTRSGQYSRCRSRLRTWQIQERPPPVVVIDLGRDKTHMSSEEGAES